MSRWFNDIFYTVVRDGFVADLDDHLHKVQSDLVCYCFSYDEAVSICDSLRYYNPHLADWVDYRIEKPKQPDLESDLPF